jgi:AraC-like DNA-binding protein
VDVKRLEEAYFQTRVLGRKQYESVLRLLAVFAQHLAAMSNQLMMARANPDEPMIAKAKIYIAENQGSLLQMKQVAQSTNTSAFHFCKKFKKATGLTFTEYLARVRVERVKNMLQNPHLRISEAAYEAGFQSLSQFGRVFRKIVGESPSRWRDKLVRHSAA